MAWRSSPANRRSSVDAGPEDGRARDARTQDDQATNGVRHNDADNTGSDRAESQRVQVRLAPLRMDEPATHIGTGHPQRFQVHDRDRDRLGLDLLVEVAP